MFFLFSFIHFRRLTPKNEFWIWCNFSYTPAGVSMTQVAVWTTDINNQGKTSYFSQFSSLALAS